MKKLILLVIGAISFSLIQAQVNFGVKAGLNLANATGSDATGSSTRSNFHAGVLAQIPVTGQFSIQPEAIYSGQGARVDFADGSGGTISGTHKLSYINVPILLKYTSASGFLVETGPQIGFLISAKASVNGMNANEKDNFESTDFSWAFGIGFMSLINIGIDARYNLGLTNVENSSNGGTTGTVKNSVIQIGAFYLFDKPKKK
jgi:hypothetical protein